MLRRLFVLVLVAALLVGCGAPATTAPAATAAPAAKTLKIVASTSWVGAFALAAGATDITVIAPSTIQHPPDYDPKPSDLAAVSKADYVLMAGFEGFAARLQEAVGGDKSKLITVMTENSPEMIHKEVTRLGELFGTQAAASAYLTKFDAEYARLSAEVKAKVAGQKPVVVAQMFAAPWAAFAGLDVAGVYGPMPMTPDELKALADKKPGMVFENYHMGGGQPLLEASGATKIDLINFPDEKMDLLAVFQTNAARIEEAFAMGASMPTEAPLAMDASTFNVSVAQYFMDAAGFHGMATKLAESKVIDATYLGKVNGVKKILAQTNWPAGLNDQAQAFIGSLGEFATALEANDVTKATEAADVVHDAQHELSHEIDHWSADAMKDMGAASTFNVIVAQNFMDAAGFHGMATTLTESKTIDAAYLGRVNAVKKILAQTVWPAGLNDQAQAFIGSLGEFATALEANDVTKATEAADVVHDAQHELSHEIDHWAGEAGAPAGQADAFRLSVAQNLMDAAGFHGMATMLTESKSIDAAYLGKVNAVKKVLAQTTWPAELNDQAQAFIGSLGEFATALEANDVAKATEAADVVHDAQHELSHEIDHWVEHNGHAASMPAHEHAAAFPVTIENCGRSLTFEKAPERVLTTWQAPPELLVKLGLGDKIVGTQNGQQFAPPAEIADAYNKLPVLAKEAASKEAVFAAKPDFILASFLAWDFDPASGAPTLDELSKAGVQVFGLSDNCTAESHVTYTDMFDDILKIGRIFGVEDRAQALVDEMKAKIANVQARVAGLPPTKAFFDAGGEGPVGTAGAGLQNEQIKLAGGVNVFEDKANYYEQVSLEEVAARQPEIFVVDTWSDLTYINTRTAWLFKTFSETPAAKAKRFVETPGIYIYFGSIRFADGIEIMAKAFHPEAFQ